MHFKCTCIFIGCCTLVSDLCCSTLLAVRCSVSVFSGCRVAGFHQNPLNQHSTWIFIQILDFTVVNHWMLPTPSPSPSPSPSPLFTAPWLRAILSVVNYAPQINVRLHAKSLNKISCLLRYIYILKPLTARARCRQSCHPNEDIFVNAQSHLSETS